SDEFQELIQSYNYFQESLRIQTEQEIRMLKKLVEKATNKELVEEIYKVLQYKSKQINVNALSAGSPHEERHVS
ncbi:MAG: hypothetical protein KDD25_10325, partial [Bdellovibrionales bacterium]|nr:hypothetical protein [Bdellovibrionales bacterium]